MNIEPLTSETAGELIKLPKDSMKNPFIASISLAGGTNFFFGTTVESKRPHGEDLVQSKRPKMGYRCKQCQSEQHFYRDCPYVKELTPYICHICNEPGHKIRDCSQKGTKKNKTTSPELCWFCLSNPALKKHLIIHIGDEIYVTLAKGGIIPEHFLIIPIVHHSSTEPIASTSFSELSKILEQISLGLDGSDLVLFTHRHNPSHHLHIQVIAIPSTFKGNDIPKFASSKGYELKSDSINLEQPFFGLMISVYANGRFKETWTYSIEEGSFFPSSFGRELVASLMNLPDRIDWRLSPLTEAEETHLVTSFKVKFK